MYCHNCGKEVIVEEGKYCPFCGAELDPSMSKGVGYVPIDQSQNQNIYQQQPQQTHYHDTDQDGPHTGFLILSFFFPVIGLILFLVWSSDYPKKANSCLKGMIAGVVTGVVLACCIFATIGSIGINGYNRIREEIREESNYEEDFDIDDFFSNSVIQIGDYE